MIENERLSILLYNAIIVLYDEGYDEKEIIKKLGMTSDEYNEVMYV